MDNYSISKFRDVICFDIKPYIDQRGEYRRIFHQIRFERFTKLALGKNKIKFVEDDISISKKNVFRGIHGDNKTWKLISCLHGEFDLYVVDCDKKSKTYMQWEKFFMSERKPMQVLIPPKFGNGHLVLSDKAIFHYKQSQYYGDNKQFTYSMREGWLFKPELKIDCEDLILSERDSG